MQFPLSKLLDTKEMICIREHQTIQEALDIMLQNDYSQLPVIDKKGDLVGLISEQSIVCKYHFLHDSVPLLNLTVDHCQATVATLPHSEDIFKALEVLEKVSAVVVVDGKKPIGILTDYDMAHFFRDVTGGLVQVEDIEITLRNYIEALLPEGDSRTREYLQIKSKA